ncbi:unnamed protein product [Paramecium sonneborni]|uniref:Uncharacterized protein n=1 Tax=Paramecium sonneborni TaxID=65129 RepID=A0A8S1QJY2_9CILI|nr:unnamed protein product [Paramecium sonneborni]
MLKSQVLGNKIVCSNETHKKQNLQIIGLCLNDDCNSKKTLCTQCFNEHDKNHKIIELSDLTCQLEEQQEFQKQQRSETYQLLSQQQNICFVLIQEKLQQMQSEANQAKQLSEQKIEAEAKYHFVNNFRNEEELEQLTKDLKNKVNNDHFNPRVIKLLNQKNSLYGYERYIRKLLFDTSLFVNNTQCIEECEYLMDNQLMSLRNLIQYINQIRQEIIVGFQNEEQNLQYIQSRIEKQDQNFSLYQSLKSTYKPQQLSDEQIQQMSNSLKFPIGQILQYYPTEALTVNQFQMIFDNPFSKVITKQNLVHLKQLSNDKSLICIGAIKQQDPNLLILCSIDYASEILQNTSNFKVARKSKAGSVYWYYKYGVFCGVIGFSPSQEIDLGNTINIHYDTHIFEGDLRFSLQVDYKSNCRVGKEIIDNQNYRWQIYLKQ